VPQTEQRKGALISCQTLREHSEIKLPLFAAMFDRFSLYRAGLCAMRTLAVIFALALIAIAGGFYSDAVLMSGRAPHADPDPVTLAVARVAKSRSDSRQ
jgi:hypothetical protein